MPFNGSGGTTQPASSLYPAVASTLIQSAKANNSIADIYAMLAMCLVKDGQQVATQRIPFAAGISTDTINEKTAGAGISLGQVLNTPQGADIVCAATINLETATGNVVDVTGSTGPVTAITLLQGHWRIVRFTGTPTLTNGASLVLPGAANIVAAAGDYALFVGYAAGVVRCMDFIRAATAPFAAVDRTPPGAVTDYAGSSVPTGWLECDASAVSRTTYAALFTAIGTTWGVGDGSTTFNLPPSSGRTRIGRGTGTVAETVAAGSVSTGSDNFTVASNNKKWITGQPVVLTTSSGLPAPLALATTYYLVRASATLIQFATSLANAQNGTVIDLTTQGTGNHTVTGTLTTRTLGEIGGEEDHAMTITQLLAHAHTDSGHAHNEKAATGFLGNFALNAGSNDVNSLTTTQATSTASAVITNTGGNQAMNTMSPFAVFMTIIKT
jgi:microcystin-dependent protein